MLPRACLLALAVPLGSACLSAPAPATDAGPAAHDATGSDVTTGDDGGMDGTTPFDGSTSDVTYPLQDAMPDGSPFLLSGLVFGDFNEAGSFVGVFYPPGTTEPPWCATTAYGACWVYDCPLPGMLDGGPPAQPQAGILTLTGPDLGGGQDLDAASNVYEYYSPSLIFSPGDMLGVSASGADVPAFGPWTIAGPGAVTVNAPAVPTDGGDIVLPTESDLTVSWTGGQAGSTVILELSSGFRNEGSSEILCQWPATDGTGTIPAAALATLLSPVPQATGSMVWYEANEMDYQAGSWKIQLWAENGGFVSATYQ